MSRVFVLLSLISVTEFQCVFSTSARLKADLKIEVTSRLNSDSQLSGKLYVDDNILAVSCRVVRNGKNDLPEFNNYQTLGKTLTSIGQAPKLALYNDTWQEMFQFPVDSWDNFEGQWKITIAREDLGFTDEIHTHMLAQLTLGYGEGKLTYWTVVFDLHSDPLWNQQFGDPLGAVLLQDIVRDDVSIERQAIAQHPCTQDTTLLLLQIDTAIILGVSLDMFKPAFSSWYNVTSLLCKQISYTVCKDLTMLDIQVTNEFVLLLTMKGLFVGELLSVESRRQNKQFYWDYVALPGEFHSTPNKDLKLQYTSACNSPTHAGDVKGGDSVILSWTGPSPSIENPHVSLPPFSDWIPMKNFTSPMRSLAYEYQTDRYFVALQESESSILKIVSYEASKQDINEGYISVFKFPASDEQPFVLTGICIHPGTHHIYAYGTQIWVSFSSGNDFTQLVSLPSNDTIISCSTSRYQGIVVFTSFTGDVYYGKSGVSRLLYVHTSSKSASLNQTYNTYITSVGHVMQINIHNSTVHVDYVKIHGQQQFLISPFYGAVAVQFLSERKVVLFDVFGQNSLGEASIGLQLSHRFGGSMLIQKVVHIPSNHIDRQASLTLVTGYLIESLVWESLSPAVQNDLNVEGINATSCWLKLPEGIDPSSGWSSSDVGKTVTMAAASSILIVQFHNFTHAVGNAVLSQLLATTYPAEKWRVYNMKAFEENATSTPENLWSLSEPACGHTLIPDEAASQYAVRFLDVGDSFTFSVTAAVTKPGFYYWSEKPLLLLSISHPTLFHTKTSYTRDRFGSETITVTILHEIFNKGESTLTVHMPDASLLCLRTSFSLTIKCACPPSKRLVFIYSPPIPDHEFLYGTLKNKKNKALLINLKPNYRPPSRLGIAIPLSDNVYNADPSKKRPRDYYEASKDSGRYKHCHNKTSREECGCLDALKLSSLQRDSDCRERAYILKHPGKIWPRFMITEQEKEDQWLEDPYVLTLREVNNRENYFVTDTPSASLIALKEAGFNLENGSSLYSTRELKITLLGSELYHFQASVIEGFSYCPLQDEFQYYVVNPPLAHPTQMIIIASVSFGIGGAIIIVYLYYLSKHYVPPVRIVGSQCMDIHLQ